MICLFDVAHQTFSLEEFIAASAVMKGLVAAQVFNYVCSRLQKCKSWFVRKKCCHCFFDLQESVSDVLTFPHVSLYLYHITVEHDASSMVYIQQNLVLFDAFDIWKCLLLVPRFGHCSSLHYPKFVKSLELYLLLLLKVFLHKQVLQPSRFQGIFGISMLLDTFLEYLLFFRFVIHD